MALEAKIVLNFQTTNIFFDEPPISASTWFSKRFRRQAEIFGCPFIELEEELVERQKITPIHLNTDFFAAVPQAIELVNLVLQREPFGLGAQLFPPKKLTTHPTPGPQRDRSGA